MKSLSHQRGVGLVEVLVAVLLLSVAVLGFSALQIRAISATDESLVRTKSMTLVRNLSEVMRAYPEAYVTGSGATFVTAAASDTGATPTIQAVFSSGATTQAVTISHSITKSDGTVEVINATINKDSCLSVDIDTDANGKKVAKQACTINQLAARDALMVKKIATDEEINLNVITCPGTTTQAIQTQMCVITAWNSTKAILDDDDEEACADTNGIYKTGSQCLISEAY